MRCIFDYLRRLTWSVKFYVSLMLTVLALGSSFGLVNMPVAQAATFNIANGDVAGLLAALNTAGPPHTINLAPGGIYALTTVDNTVGGFVTVGTGLPVISGQITINGNGATITRAGGAPNFRFFYVAAGGNLTLNHLILTNGNVGNANYGGAIYNEFGTVSLNNSTITNNTAFNGGGIFNGSFVSGSTATLTVNNSTFNNNTASFGGAVYSVSVGNVTTATITNSTFFQNTVTGNGGAINNYGSIPGGTANLSAINLTIANNTATTGGGIINFADPGRTATATLQNSLIANNAGANCANTNAPFAAGNNNLEFPGGAPTCGAGSTIAAANPLAGSILASNGGPTQTLALPAGSGAIGAGGAGCPAFDQRYFSRTPGPCDIGAYQRNGTAFGSPVSKAFNPSTISVGGTSTLTLTLNNANSFALTNISFTDNFPTQVQVAAAPVNNCGSGTVTAAIGSSVITVAGVNLVIGAPACTITVVVTSNTAGNYSNTTGIITSNELPASLNFTSNTVILSVGIAPPTPTPTPTPNSTAKPEVRPADLVAQLRVNPDRFAATDPTTLISYTLSVKNVGLGGASSVSVRFPLDANLTLGFAAFSHPRAWVSAIVTNTVHPYIQLGLPALPANSLPITATLVFRPSADAKAATEFFTRYTVLWDDDEKPARQQLSNAVRFNLSTDNTNRNDTDGAVQFFNPATISASNGIAVRLSGDFYIPNELVTFWYTDKDGVSTTLGTKQADVQGNLIFEFSFQALPTDSVYTVVGLGNRSEVSGSAVLIIT